MDSRDTRLPTVVAIKLFCPRPIHAAVSSTGDAGSLYTGGVLQIGVHRVRRLSRLPLPPKSSESLLRFLRASPAPPLIPLYLPFNDRGFGSCLFSCNRQPTDYSTTQGHFEPLNASLDVRWHVIILKPCQTNASHTTPISSSPFNSIASPQISSPGFQGPLATVSSTRITPPSMAQSFLLSSRIWI